MLSKTQNKYIRSLTQQKFRKEYNVFVVEGDKIAREWLDSSAMIRMIVGLQVWLDMYGALVKQHPEAAVHAVPESELAAISGLQTANQVLLVVDMPANPPDFPGNEWCIILDKIQDPGNMGTIIRIADWFGIKHILCTNNCVDTYNSKVIQSAMGSHLRVIIHNEGAEEFLVKNSMPVLAATLEGENVYRLPKINAGVLVIGNESKGISDAIMKFATQKITIPRLGAAESLNAAVSAGILCALLVGRNEG